MNWLTYDLNWGIFWLASDKYRSFQLDILPNNASHLFANNASEISLNIARFLGQYYTWPYFICHWRINHSILLSPVWTCIHALWRIIYTMNDAWNNYKPICDRLSIIINHAIWTDFDHTCLPLSIIPCPITMDIDCIMHHCGIDTKRKSFST
jgi:hypothetical protein